MTADYSFQAVVSSPFAVRSAFDHTLARVWWAVIMALHGKPGDVEMPDDERTACLAAVFRFYAHLYAAVAGLLALIAGAFAALPADIAGLG